jgi:hypothetical protein
MSIEEGRMLGTYGFTIGWVRRGGGAGREQTYQMVPALSKYQYVLK